MHSNDDVVLGWTHEDGDPSPFGFAAPRLVKPPAATLLRDPSPAHIAVFAPTGAGKGRNVLIPMLLESRKPAIVLDIKGELAQVTAEYRKREFDHEIAIIDPWQMVTSDPALFNPLDTLDPDSPSAVDDAYSMAGELVDPRGPSKEAYWDDNGQGVNAGLMLDCILQRNAPERSLARVWRIVHGDDTLHNMAKLLDDAKNLHPFVLAQIGGLLQIRAEVTQSCILSVVRQHLRPFGSELVQQSLSATSFDLDKVRNGGPLTIYLVVPPNKLRSHAALLRLWISSLLNLICKRRERPQDTTLLLVDEMAQLGRMDQIKQAVTLMRGYGLKCVLFLQSYAQLVQLYPDEHEVFFENCGTILTFGHTSMSMSDRLSRALGDINSQTLFGMESDELAIRVPGEPTRIARRMDYVLDNHFKNRFAPHPMHNSPIAQLE